MTRKGWYLAGMLLVIWGCGPWMMMGLPGMGMFDGNVTGYPPPGASDDDTNGERIFNTGYNLDGEKIAFEDGPFWLSRHGGGCAACHGVDGSGGLWVMMTDELSPDIRYSHLTEEEHEEGEEHPPYDDERIAQAIRDGLNPAGEELSTAMPRWQLSEEDMADLIAYLKTLDGDDHDEE